MEKDRKELDLLDKEMGKGKTELKLLHEAIQKRHSQLEGLDKEVEREVNSRRKEIKVSFRIVLYFLWRCWHVSIIYSTSLNI